MVVYIVKFRLIDVQPLIWRKVRVPAGITFHQLHEIIQTVMGFEGFHGFDFNIRDIGERIIDFDKALQVFPGECNSRETIIDDYFDKYNEIIYTYDFDSNWEVLVEIMSKTDDNIDYPEITGFKGDYNPIEDCGGPFEFELILNKDKDNDNEDKIDPIVEKKFDKFLDNTFDKYSDADFIGLDNLPEENKEDVMEDFDKFLGNLLNENLKKEGHSGLLNEDVSGFLDFLENLSVVFDEQMGEFVEKVSKKYDVDDFEEIEDENLKEQVDSEFEQFFDKFLGKYLLKNEFDNMLTDDLSVFEENFVLEEFNMEDTQEILTNLFS